ncbi:MAG: M3 family metallopeptidase [Patescibacteria group bacterium]
MKYKTEWNLGLLYKNENDPQIDKDVLKLEKLCESFEKKYKGKDFISSSTKLAQALEEHEILSHSQLFKPWLYFYLTCDIHTDNQKAFAKKTSVEQRVNTSSNKVSFFVLEIAKIAIEKQTKYLSEQKLKKFRYYLQKIFLNAKYNLSEKEEQLITLFSQTSETMWVDIRQKILLEQTVAYNGKKIPFSKAKDLYSDLPKNKRHSLYKRMTETAKSVSTIAEAELNALGNYRKVIDERRGFKMPYSSSVLNNENTEKEIEDFAALVTSKFHIAHRFYKIHAKLLNEKKLTFADRRVQLGKIKRKFDFDTVFTIAKSALARAGKKYANLLEEFMQNGQIDVYPRKGKQSGGYQIAIGTLPTFILLNFTESVQIAETITHEMGHAIHSKLSLSQPIIYQHYTTSVAEVASMFFEQFTALELDQYLSEEEQFILLHRKIFEDVYAIFAQVACFNFETELHQQIRKQGQLSKEDMAKLLQKHMQGYCGPAINVTEDDGYLFVHWNHIRYYFYTYSYAYGGLISRTLFENWKKDHSYINKVEQFLSAGKSMSPKDIFASIGIKTDKAFFEQGLKGIEADVDKLEKLAKKLSKI